MTNTSLYDQRPANWNLIAAYAPALAEMAKHFSRGVDMDRALGLNGAASNWHCARSRASVRSNELAQEWLTLRRMRAERNAKPPASLYDPALLPEPAPTPAPSPTANLVSAEGDMLLVVCPPAKREKVQRMLSLMGCEVEPL